MHLVHSTSNISLIQKAVEWTLGKFNPIQLLHCLYSSPHVRALNRTKHSIVTNLLCLQFAIHATAGNWIDYKHINAISSGWRNKIQNPLLRVSTSDMASLIVSNMFQLLCYILPELHIVRALTLPKSTSFSLKVRNRCSLKLHLLSFFICLLIIVQLLHKFKSISLKITNSPRDFYLFSQKTF